MEWIAVPESFRDRWEGPAWRWWSLLAGVVLAALAAVLGGVISLVSGRALAPLVMIALLVELLVLSGRGSGMLEGRAGRAIAGGMARQPLPERRRRGQNLSEAERQRRDRSTIRSGLLALPVLAAFLTLLFG